MKGNTRTSAAGRGIAYCRLGALALLLCACSHRLPDGEASTDGPASPAGKDSVGCASLHKTEKQIRLDSFFRALHQQQGFNGTVLVAQQGKVIYRGAFGYADLKRKDTLTTHSVFQLASLTKPFTALAVMVLAEKGMLSYEDPVQRFFPVFPYPSVTIRQLLTHQSGLPDYLKFAPLYWPDRSRPLSNQELIGQLARHKPPLLFRPGSRFAYSNTGYCVLAAVVEKASGMPFAQFVKARVLDPSGMKHSGFFHLVAPTGPLAVGHSLSRKAIRADYLDGLAGDKGLYASAEDLFLWDRALASNAIIQQSTLAEAFQKSSQVYPAIEYYGFGWRVRLLGCGEWVLYHSGRWHGFRSYLMRNLRDQSTVIVLSNVDKLIDAEYFQYILYPPAPGTRVP